MPRTRKTLSGQDAQPVGAVAGQMYGMGEEQMALQRAMPAPQVGGPPAAPAGGPSAPPAGAAPPAGPQPDVRALAAALANRGNLFTQPTKRPGEPVTAGLSRGPGPGPEALGQRMGSPAGAFLRTISARTGNPEFADLADRTGA